MPETGQQWLLLLHQIPPTPPYFRAKVLRRLNQVGALAIKNSAYVLPETDDTIEDFQWLRREIAERGGEAWLFRAELVSGLSNATLVHSFQELRSSEYAQLLYEGQQLLDAIWQGKTNGGSHESDCRKLKRRLEEIRRIDFFEAPERKKVEEIMDAIGSALAASDRTPAIKPDPNSLKGKTWVTRRGIKVDRIGTAWLVRRFIDPAAKFRFVDQDRYAHAAGEIRFDMFEGEFTHEGDLCTFEALLHHTGIHDPALETVAQVVHDIDLKDEKYQRPETAGVAAQINGIALLHSSDEARLEDGSRIFEAMYAGLRAAGKG